METLPATKPWFSKRVTLLCVLVVSAVGMVASLLVRRRKPSALQDAGHDLQNLCERLGVRCPTATSRCPDGYLGPHCQTEAPWLALAYGFDVDPDSPYFIRKTSKIFDISSDDVDLTPDMYADGKIVYSTSEKTVAEHMAANMGVAGYFGAFSAAASMAVSSSAESSIKTVRLDSLVRFNQQRAMTAGAFRTQPHTKLDQSLKAYIEGVPLSSVQDIAETLGSFYARSANLGGVVQKTYTMQATADDNQVSVEAALRAGRGNWFIGGEGSFTDSHTTRTDVEGAQMSTRFHAEGGDTKLWLAVDGRGTNFEEVRQRWAASFAADGHDLYPWGLELRPIWEVVERIDAAKGQALRDHLTQKWERQAHAFRPVNYYTQIPRAVELTGATEWLNGIYTRAAGKFCNGKPVYQTSTYGEYLYQASGTSQWWVGRSERAASCEARGYIHTWGLVCDARPDCAGRWLKTEGCAETWWGGKWCDAHGLAVREAQCPEVCGAHHIVVANAVTCECSCRDGFSGPRCEVDAAAVAAAAATKRAICVGVTLLAVTLLVTLLWLAAFRLMDRWWTRMWTGGASWSDFACTALIILRDLTILTILTITLEVVTILITLGEDHVRDSRCIDAAMQANEVCSLLCAFFVTARPRAITVNGTPMIQLRVPRHAHSLETDTRRWVIK